MSNSLGKASIILTAESAQMSAGMKKAAEEAKKRASEIRSHLGEKLGGAAGGGIGEAIGGATKLGAIGVAIAGVITIGKELYAAAFNAKAFARELEKGQEALDLWAERAGENLTRMKERLTEFDDVAGTKEGVQKYTGELAKAERQLADLNKQVESSKATAASLDSKWNSFDNFGKWMRSELEDTEKDAQESAKKIRAVAENQRRAVEELRRRNHELLNPRESIAARTELRKFIKEQEDAVKDLTRSADEARLDRLSEKFGFKGADLGAARLAVAAKNAATADQWIKELTRDVDDLAKGITRGAEESKLEELVKAGIDAKQIARIKELIDLKKQQNQQYNPLKAMEANTWEAITFQNRVKFDKEKQAGVKQEKLMQEMVQKLIQINFSIMGLHTGSPEI